MKTNVVMRRPLGQFEVLQRTSDGYFNAGALFDAFCLANNVKKRMAHFFALSQTEEFIEVLAEQESHSRDYDNGDFQAVITIKGRNTKMGKTKDEVWMHPYLFIKFAMWLNPKFEYYVIKFVYDELIKNRIDACDNYKKLCEAMSKIGATTQDYKDVAKLMNVVVFGKHAGELRQIADESKLKELYKLEDFIANSIKAGFLNNVWKVKGYLISKIAD